MLLKGVTIPYAKKKRVIKWWSLVSFQHGEMEENFYLNNESKCVIPFRVEIEEFYLRKSKQNAADSRDVSIISWFLLYFPFIYFI